MSESYVYLKKAAKELAQILGKGLKKNTKGIDDFKILESIYELYKETGYVPISRVPDLKYSISIIDALLGQISGENIELRDIIEWAKISELTFDEKDPLDLVRLMLDISMEICLRGHYDARELLNIDLGPMTFAGWSDLLRGLSDFAATQFTHMYLFHMGQLTTELYRRYMKVPVSSLPEVISKDEEELERFRVYVTSKIFPTAKAILLQQLLVKFRWPIFLMEKKDIDSLRGVRNIKMVEPSYLGRITSEIIDSMAGLHYDESILKAYDTIVSSYFNVIKEFSNAIKNGYDVDYIESHPAMNQMIDDVNRVMEELTPQTKRYLLRRGIIRLGEVKQDIKDYVLTLYYLSKKALSYQMNWFTEITKYDIYTLVENNKLLKV